MAAKYFTTFEASRLLGVSLPTIVNWIKGDRLRAHRTPGGHRRIAREDLLYFLRRYEMPIPEELLAPQEGQPKILAVDDDPDERELLKEILEGAGFSVLLAADGFEAGLVVGGFRPNLVVLDLLMPTMDGFAALAALRARKETAATPVIACTGMGDEETRRRVQEAGFDAHVVKPYRPEELISLISRLLLPESELMARAR